MNRSPFQFRHMALMAMAFAAASTFAATSVLADPPPPKGDGPLAGPRQRQRGQHPPRHHDDEMGPPHEDGPRRGEPGEPRGPEGRRREGFDRWRRAMDGDGPLNERMVERILSELKTRLPEWHDKLVQLRERDRAKFDSAIRRMMPMIRETMMLKERNPELAETIFEEFRIEHELHGLAEKYKAAAAANDSPLQGQISSEIDTRVRRQFELRMQRRQAQLEEFARRLAEQQKRIEKQIAEQAEQAAHAEEFISKRIEEIKKGEFRGPSLFDRGGRAGPGRPGGPDDEFGPPGPRMGGPRKPGQRMRGMRPRPGDGPPPQDGPGDRPRRPRDDARGPDHDGPPPMDDEDDELPPPPGF